MKKFSSLTQNAFLAGVLVFVLVIVINHQQVFAQTDNASAHADPGGGIGGMVGSSGNSTGSSGGANTGSGNNGNSGGAGNTATDPNDAGFEKRLETQGVSGMGGSNSVTSGNKGSNANPTKTTKPLPPDDTNLPQAAKDFLKTFQATYGYGSPEYNQAYNQVTGQTAGFTTAHELGLPLQAAVDLNAEQLNALKNLSAAKKALQAAYAGSPTDTASYGNSLSSAQVAAVAQKVAASFNGDTVAAAQALKELRQLQLGDATSYAQKVATEQALSKYTITINGLPVPAETVMNHFAPPTAAQATTLGQIAHDLIAQGGDDNLNTAMRMMNFIAPVDQMKKALSELSVEALSKLVLGGLTGMPTDLSPDAVKTSYFIGKYLDGTPYALAVAASSGGIIGAVLGAGVPVPIVGSVIGGLADNVIGPAFMDKMNQLYKDYGIIAGPDGTIAGLDKVTGAFFTNCTGCDQTAIANAIKNGTITTTPGSVTPVSSFPGNQNLNSQRNGGPLPGNIHNLQSPGSPTSFETSSSNIFADSVRTLLSAAVAFFTGNNLASEQDRSFSQTYNTHTKNDSDSKGGNTQSLGGGTQTTSNATNTNPVLYQGDFIVNHDVGGRKIPVHIYIVRHKNGFTPDSISGDAQAFSQMSAVVLKNVNTQYGPSRSKQTTSSPTTSTRASGGFFQGLFNFGGRLLNTGFGPGNK